MSEATETELPPDPTVERIRALMTRKGWGHNETARNLGVPTGTFGNWMQGTTKPNLVVARLLDVLATVETFAPHIYAAILAEPKK